MTSSHPTRAGKARDSKLVNEHHLLHLMLHLQTPLNQDTSSYKRSHRQDAGRKDADVSRKATAQDLDAKDRHPHVWSMAGSCWCVLHAQIWEITGWKLKASSIVRGGEEAAHKLS